MEYQSKRHDILRSQGATEGELEWLLLETVGGKCPKCKRDWRKVIVKNIYANFEYYKPACECYETCAGCGKSLYGTVPPGPEKHHYKCPACGHREPQRWRLTCASCGVNGVTHEGKYYRFVCPECKKRSARYKKNELE